MSSNLNLKVQKYQRVVFTRFWLPLVGSHLGMKGQQAELRPHMLRNLKGLYCLLRLTHRKLAEI